MSARVVVVLGYSDGGRGELHPVCAARLERAAEIATSEDVVVLSGWARVSGTHSEAALMRHADTAKATTNLWGERWSKLIINGMRNGLSAATGMSGKERDGNPKTRDISLRLGAEAIRVGWALGYRLEKIAGVTAEMLVAAVDGDRKARAEVDADLDRQIAHRSDEQRPSMGQDMRKGRRTEIELINGLIAAKGDETGVPTPVNKALVAAVKKVERGEMAASPEVVAHI